MKQGLETIKATPITLIGSGALYARLAELGWTDVEHYSDRVPVRSVLVVEPAAEAETAFADRWDDVVDLDGVALVVWDGDLDERLPAAPTVHTFTRSEDLGGSLERLVRLSSAL